MQAGRILQVAALMLIVGLATSCASSKEYSSKLFAPRISGIKDTQNLALRFLELDAFDTDKQGEGWVTTDIINGKDTSNQSAILDNFVKNFPAKTDSIASFSQKETKDVKTTVVNEPIPVAKNAKPGDVRNKRTRE